MDKSELRDAIAKLLTPKRFRDSSVIKDPTDGRNSFDNDYSRIVLSSHFRRLQDKAQVFPLEQCDFVRTRLTHSIEASCFARGLGLGVEQKLFKSKLITQDYAGQIPSVLSVAGLIHDIGNPPFGHFGEETIKSYFSKLNDPENNLPEAVAFRKLEAQEIHDFLNFDGNVQGFRILRKLGLASDEFSYNLTYPVLSTIIKYPYSSTDGNNKSGKHCQKKFGFFKSEEADYNTIIDTLGLTKNHRHPLTYLLEAADDIAYSVSDIEDGYKLGIIDLRIIKKAFADCKSFLNGLKSDESNMDLYIQRLRIKAQKHMLIEVTKTFNAQINSIVKGEFDKDLIESSNAKNVRAAFKKLGTYNFSHSTVLKRELLGNEVISYLIDLFTSALFSPNLLGPDGKIDRKSKESKIFALISNNYVSVACSGHSGPLPTDNYKKFMLITDYISGMTDSYALNLYQELTGRKLI